MSRNKQTELKTTESSGLAVEEQDTAELMPAVPIRPIPLSGLYATAGLIPGLWEESGTEGEEDAASPIPMPGRLPIRPIPLPLGEELRLDVDGRYPLMTASGSIPLTRLQRVHWIARLKLAAPNTYIGAIWYKEPATSPFAYTTIRVTAKPLVLPSDRAVNVTFSGPGLADRVRTYSLKSPYFHKVEFEYDCEQGIQPEITINTCAHPNRPASMPCENISISTVYRRAGFDVSLSPSPSVIPGAPGSTWSNAEMHDAMQTYWGRFASKAQWAMWVLFAGRHEMGPSLGGIMFDSIGPNHRQGTSLFYNSFISDAPAGDPAPAAYKSRMRFWTAVHEMGHGFNLAHSWQKSLGIPWMPLADEPEARSFMNYPYNVSGGQTAFFSSFGYRFSPGELLFMRHAPARFVRMGDAPWFDHHGFEAPGVHPEPPFSLELRFNRTSADFEFLEPIVAELKLKNISSQPQLIDENVLENLDRITIATVKQGRPARRYVPYAQYCTKPLQRVLQPGESIYSSVFLSAGLNGPADLSEPGFYVLQAALHLDDGDVVSPLVHLKMRTPQNAQEENIAQDFFTDDVGRFLAFDGSRCLESARKTLETVVENLSGHAAAIHAGVALGQPLLRPFNELNVKDGAEASRAGQPLEAEFKRQPPDLDEARRLLDASLRKPQDQAAASLGHIDYAYYIERLAETVEDADAPQEAKQLREVCGKVLRRRGVSESILKGVETHYAEARKERRKAAGK